MLGCYGECVYLKANLYDPTTPSAGGETSIQSEVSTSITGDPGFELLQTEDVSCPAASSSTSGTNKKCDSNFTPAPRTTTCARDLKQEFPNQTTEEAEQMDLAF